MSDANGGPRVNPLDDLVSDDPPAIEAIEAAAAVEAKVGDDLAYGQPGRPLDRRSPFWIANAATFGAAVAGVCLWAIYLARGVLVLLLLALFIAAGLDPVVRWLARRGIPRGLSVLVVVLAGLAAFAGILDLVVPVVVRQVTELVNALPRYARELNNSSSFIGRINNRYHVEKTVQTYLTKGGGSIATGVLGVGKIVLSAVASTVIVLVVSIYLLVDMPRFK